MIYIFLKQFLGGFYMQFCMRFHGYTFPEYVYTEVAQLQLMQVQK